MTTLTAVFIEHDGPDRTEETSAFGRSPLRLLLLLSLALHAAAIGLWPEAAAVISEPLPAGPIAVRLQNAATGSRAATGVESVAPPPVNKAAARREERATPQRTAPATPPERHAAASQPARTPVAAHRAASAATGDEPQGSITHAASAIGAERDGELREQLRGRLNNALIAHFEYPMTARRRGWEGVVRVGLRVEANGRLTGLRVIGSSGHAVLDRAALNSLGRVGRLPDAISWLQGRRFDMVLPVRYQLIDS